VAKPAAPSPIERYLARAPAPGRRERPLDPWVILAAFGPCGFSPVAPGTVGTLGAVPLYWALSRLSFPPYLIATAALFAVGVHAAGRAGQYWGVVDASPIVIDEVVGYLVTVALVPWSWPAAIAAFLLFRVMDVVKPWPASAFDRVKNGFGVVLDDVAAGVYAYLAFEVLRLGLRHFLGCGGGPHFWCAEFFQ